MRILHITDLHYRESPETWTLLKEAGRQFEVLRPDYILITGDLTNDGLDEQFERVKRFIATLDFCEVLIIMDTLENVNHGRQGKFFDHFDATEFFYRANGIAAVGLNSTPEITPRQMELAAQHFDKGQPGELRIFCAHHSFLPVPTKKLKPGDTVPRAADILQTLIELNVDLLCCGHIHRTHVWDLSDGRHRLLCCNAGSLLDTSGKKDNGFLDIEIGRDLRISKRTLFSRRTEVLYSRLHFGAMLRERQQNASIDTAGSSTPLSTGDEKDAGIGRTKTKKSKSKK